MPKLFIWGQAEIPEKKVYQYLLNQQHETGKHKARVYKAIGSVTKDDGVDNMAHRKSGELLV